MRGDSMTKTLEQIQEFNRRKIICAVNGTENYEEALEKELIFGCIVIDLKHQFFGIKDPHEMTLVYDTEDGEYYFDHYRGNPFVIYREDEILNKERFQIIGKPLTLDRVLLALLKINDNLRVKHKEESIIELYQSIWCEDCEEYELRVHFIFDLTKRSLEKQSEETQKDIYELLGGEND